jgi:hypothetical protein
MRKRWGEYLDHHPNQGGRIVNSEEKPKRQRRKKAAAEGTTVEVEGKARPASRKKGGKAQAQALVQAPADKVFWLRDGAAIANLRELRDALESGMSDEQFAHHVGPGRNDFACWVEDVLGSPGCARALRQASTRQDAARAVAASLVA